MNDKKRSEEKERLMREILDKRKPLAFSNDDLLASQNSVLNEINDVIKKQNEELDKLSKSLDYEISDADLNDLKSSIEKDFNIKFTDTSLDNFTGLFEDISKNFIGQDKAIQDLIKAFKRPLLVPGNTRKNSLVVIGKKGMGRHLLISLLAENLYNRRIITSKEVHVINMELYTSSTHEQVFLQDMYMALKGKGQIICFENFELAYPPFIRMLAQLVVEDKMILNKRYVLNKGHLSEAQTGLVENAVGYFTSNNKYLVFISENKLSKIQDTFGSKFIEAIQDVIVLEDLKDDDISILITNKLKELQESIKHLEINLSIETSTNDYIRSLYSKDEGIDSIEEIIQEIYKKIIEIKLEDSTLKNINLRASKNLELVVEDKIYTLNTNNEKEEILKEIDKELDEVVGLDNVKDYIKSLKDHLEISRRRKLVGMKTSEVSKHMIFTGNPGTGKTTIARLISRYMKAIGALSQGQLVEVTRADLVGKYVGHTAPLTMQVIKSAIGGVLFIDEAYSLYRGKDDNFGIEAIDTLVKAMEDFREDLIVILAGYSKEMETFLEANSGLKSRFPNIINFKDYTGEELVEISKIIAKNKGYEIEEIALNNLLTYYTKVQEENAREAGNGRMARNIIEEAILNQAKRLIQDPNASYELLLNQDFDLN